LTFRQASVIAVCGADMKPTLDGAPLPMWESVAIAAGQTLVLSFASVGARTYIAVAGGIDTPPWLGSRSTFHKAGVGGMEGHALKAGQSVPVGKANGTAGRKVKPEARPTFSTNKSWTVEVVAGPNDDWAPSTSPDRRPSSWSMTGRAWGASSIPIPCRPRRFGSSARPSPPKS
jgi:urea carboxylase